MIYKRQLQLPENPTKSFFLWGPWQTGKTTLLKAAYPDALRIDLLKTDDLVRFTQRPALLRELVQVHPPDKLVVIDEIQKAPALLDEIHYLIQERGQVFVMCGSSARKLRRGQVNLLGGRALRHELLGLSSVELGENFSLERMLNTGPLPDHYDADDAAPLLRAYVQDYLREEILEEGLARNLPVFSDFLRTAAIGDTEVLNMTNVAREVGVAASTVRGHYAILEDTLMGAFLPCFTLRPKRRTVQAPKFFFRDVGVVNLLTRRKSIEPGSQPFGKAFENWLFHELSAHTRYSGLHYDICYWRLSSGIEVDFILGQAGLAVEAKGKQRVTETDLRGLVQFQKEYPDVPHRILVCLEPQRRRTDDGIDILPWQDFIRGLWQGDWNEEL